MSEPFIYEAKCGGCGAILGTVKFDYELTEEQRYLRCEASYCCTDCAQLPPDESQQSEGGSFE